MRTATTHHCSDPNRGDASSNILPVFCVAWVLMVVMSIAVSLLEARLGFPKSRWLPFSDPLLGDLMEYPGTYQLLHRAAFFSNSPIGLPACMFSAVAYPPLAAVVLAPIYLFGSPICNFIALAIAVVVLLLSQISGNLRSAGWRPLPAFLAATLIPLTSFPFLRLLHQGNVEIVLWLVVALGIWAFLRGHSDTAALFWGCAAAMKLYPLVLLLLFVPKRRYAFLSRGVGAFVASTWISLLWLGPTVAVAWRGSIRNVFGYQSLRVQEWSLDELVANHSAFQLVKLVAAICRYPFAHLSLVYYACCALVILGISFTRFPKLPLANQVLIVTILMVVVPTVSYYHTLVHLFIPLSMLAVVASRRGGSVPGIRLTMLLFIPLFAPYTLFTFPHLFLFCGVVQATVLLVLLLCALQFPFAENIDLPDGTIAAC